MTFPSMRSHIGLGPGVAFSHAAPSQGRRSASMPPMFQAVARLAIATVLLLSWVA